MQNKNWFRTLFGSCSIKPGQKHLNLCKGPGILLASIILMAGPVFVLAQESLPPSSNPVIKKAEEEFLPKTRKGKLDEQANAFYDLGKQCFENHDAARAEFYMRQAANLQSQLKS